jgi:conjugal transfer ATP-binding protein TraC
LRKYNGSLIVGTQQLEDFYTSPGALAAFSNSDWACFLPQFEGSIEKIQEKIKMPEGKVKAINSLNTVHGLYSEVLICQGHSYSKHRLWLDAFSNLLYSTQPNDYARVSELRSKGMNLEDTIEEIIRERTC